jgi:AcrR family transcriptional regulator
MEILAADGHDGLTMVRLAEQVDAAVGALYRYFPGKDEIIVALQRRAVEGFRVDLEAALAAADDAPPLEQVHTTATAWLHDAEVAPARHRLIASSLATPDRHLSDADALAVQGSIQPILTHVVGRLDQAVERRDLAPGDNLQRTHVIWAVLQGLDHFRKLDRLRPASLQTGALARAALDALFEGWRTA